jgi:hypothetical protein
LPVLFLPALLAGILVIVPGWLIQPFRPQSPRDLEISFLLRSWSPLLTLLLTALAIAGAIAAWSGRRGILRRGLIVLAVILPGLFAWLARGNHFEMMFHPLARPGFVPAGEARFLDGTDRILGVALNGEAAAYPVRQLAYHHLVHDRVGGVDLIVTY